MRTRLLCGLLAVGLTGAGCAAKAAPPAPAPTYASDAVRVARIVRLMELTRHRVSLELERTALAQRYGDNHPDMRSIVSQLGTLDAAIAREFLPEEEAAVAAYEDRAIGLRLRLQEETAKGHGENHPDVVAVRRQIATLEQMAGARRAPRTEAVLLATIQEDPQAPAPQVELALFYLRAGRAADASRALERALSLLRNQR